MKKVLITLLLLGIILCLSSFIYLKISANGPENNFFNTNWRHKIAKNYFARQTLGLHNSGDARYDYLGEDSEEILLEINSMERLRVNDSLLEELAARIKSITGKATRYIYLDKGVPYDNSSRINNLEIEAKMHRVYYQKNRQSVLYILVAGSLADEPARLGSTLGNDGVILFLDTLNKYAVGYSANDDPEILDKSAIEVLLHEFGHQLGLEHNDNSGCLMSEQTEFSADRKKEDIILEFCESEKKEMAEFKKRLK